MTDPYLLTYVYPAAMELLPPRMDSLAAKAMLLTIALQESRLTHRRQVHGPARGFWQFEKGGGVTGVLHHQDTAEPIRHVCEALSYSPTVNACYPALEHNDVLACAFARLLLWTVPDDLPSIDEAERGWSQYLVSWRPGKPHRATWDAYFKRAWETVL